MTGFRIVVDSCCDIGSDAIRVPLTIQVGEVSLVDDHTLVQANLLARMRDCPDAPKTACPSPALFMDAYGDGSEDVYVVTLSAVLSGSYNSALQAASIWKESHPDANIHVFNARSACAGQALLVLKIREFLAEGLPFNAVVAAAEGTIAGMTTLFVLDSLENLRKNGRLSTLQVIVTSALPVKLIMGTTEAGEICKKGQAIGIRQAVSKMAGFIISDLRHIGKILTISHCNCLERAVELRDRLARECRFSQILISDTGGVGTVYASDGGLVVAY